MSFIQSGTVQYNEEIKYFDLKLKLKALLFRIFVNQKTKEIPTNKILYVTEKGKNVWKWAQLGRTRLEASTTE